MIPTVAPYLLPKILGPIRKSLPTLRIQLTEGQTAVITRLLREGDLDRRLAQSALSRAATQAVARLRVTAKARR
jgi:LysR family hydrogen peroxide-inducible transcriptional activator